MKALLITCGILFSTALQAYDPMHIALVRQVQPYSNADYIAQQQLRADLRAYQMELYLKKMFHYRGGEVKVRAFVMPSNCDSRSPYYCKIQIWKMVPDMRTEDFDPQYFNIWAAWRWEYGFCGQAERPGNFSVTWAGCGEGVNIHEHLHNLGLRHANKDGVEYQDTTSLMGNTTSLRGLNTMDLLQLDLNWTEPLLVTKSQQVLLVPVELYPASMHPGEVQHVIINDVHLSIRKTKGFPYTAGLYAEHTLYVHVRGEYNTSNLIDSLEPGDRAMHGSTLIEYLEYSNETARVSITMADNMIPIDAIINKDLPMSAPTIEPIHNGLWYNSDYNGQGFDIHVKGERVVVTWYTFSEKHSNPRFYIASGDVYDKEMQLFTTDGSELQPAGTIQLHFFEDMAGVVNYNTPQYGRGSVYIEPLMLGHNDKSGLFYTPGIPYEGFSAHFYGDEVNMFWFTHGLQPIANAFLEEPFLQRWFMFSGKKAHADTYYMDIYEVSEGRLLMFNDVTVTNVGHAILYPDMTIKIVMSTNNFNDPIGFLKLERLF